MVIIQVFFTELLTLIYQAGPNPGIHFFNFTLFHGSLKVSVFGPFLYVNVALLLCVYILIKYLSFLFSVIHVTILYPAVVGFIFVDFLALVIESLPSLKTITRSYYCSSNLLL